MLSNIRLGLLGLFCLFYLKMSDENLSGRKNVIEPLGNVEYGTHVTMRSV